MQADTFEASIRELLIAYGATKGIRNMNTPDDVLKDSLDIVEFIILVEEKFDQEIADSAILVLRTNSLAALSSGLFNMLNPASA